MANLALDIMVCRDCFDVLAFGDEAGDPMIFYSETPEQGERRFAEVNKAIDALIAEHKLDWFDAAPGQDELDETRESGEGDKPKEGNPTTIEFSWSPCECCGSTLGGSRHRAMGLS